MQRYAVIILIIINFLSITILSRMEALVETLKLAENIMEGGGGGGGKIIRSQRGATHEPIIT